MNTLQQAARRLITASAAAGITLCLFAGVNTMAAPQHGQQQLVAVHAATVLR